MVARPRKRMYRTMQGKMVDIEKLRSANEAVRAVGNMNVNARGDVLTRSGDVMQTKAEVMFLLDLNLLWLQDLHRNHNQLNSLRHSLKRRLVKQLMHSNQKQQQNLRLKLKKVSTRHLTD